MIIMIIIITIIIICLYVCIYVCVILQHIYNIMVFMMFDDAWNILNNVHEI